MTELPTTPISIEEVRGADVSIEAATIDHVPDLVSIHLASEQSRFPENVDPEISLPTLAEIQHYHQQSDLATRSRLQNERDILHQPHKDVRIARIGRTIVGFSSYDNSVNDLNSLYVLPEFHGYGIGSTLLQQCLETADRRPTRVITSMHTPSVGFYLRRGFAIDGPVPPEICPQVTPAKRLPLINMIYVPQLKE